jgi:hypothetical protein
MYFFMSQRGFAGSACALFITAAGLVCSAQQFPIVSDAAAQVISMNGEVSVLRTAGADPWALNVGDKIQVQQVILTGPDGYAKFQVSDGSTFDVYPNSNVVFRKNPGNLKDLLDLIVGRVKIHIQRFGGQPNPNRIMTPTAVISVRGTTFDVVVDDDDESTLVAVEEGSVDVLHRLKPTKERTVNAGETIKVYRNEPLSQSVIDKGELIQKVLRALQQAVYTAITNPGTHSIPGVPTSPGTPGDTAPPPPPSTPPPPPPGH